MNITDRAKNIILRPTTEWAIIDSENITLQKLITSYLLPLSLIGAIASLIGFSVIGYSVFGVHEGSISWGVIRAMQFIVHAILVCIIATYIIDALAPTFKSEKNLTKSAELVIYSYTPGLLGAVFSIFPSISILGTLCTLYGIYLVFVGLHTIKKTPDDQRIGYIVVTVLILIAVYVIIGVVISSIIGSIWGLENYRGY